jgi:hypothetical protein
MPEAKRLADGRYQCQNCPKRFHAHPRSPVEPKFCSNQCRKEFHYNGGMSLAKFKDAMVKIADERILAMILSGALRSEYRKKAEAATS